MTTGNVAVQSFLVDTDVGGNPLIGEVTRGGTGIYGMAKYLIVLQRLRLYSVGCVHLIQICLSAVGFAQNL